MSGVFRGGNPGGDRVVFAIQSNNPDTDPTKDGTYCGLMTHDVSSHVLTCSRSRFGLKSDLFSLIIDYERAADIQDRVLPRANLPCANRSVPRFCRHDETWKAVLLVSGARIAREILQLPLVFVE